jgi:6-phosphogluconolactonase
MAAVETYPDAESLAQAGAEHFVTLAKAAIAAHGRFAVALSGGSTPRGLYARLASDEFSSQMDWPRVHLFWGDERCVPPDHPDSNYLLARETLIDHLPIPAENVHRIRGELEPEEAASDYEHTLRTFFAPPADENEKPIPRFDLILLGMGTDGHTASLFPGSAALHERRRWVVAYYVDKLHAWRITVTPIVINAAIYVTFLVSGASKAERLQQVLTGPYEPDLLPAQIVKPDDGHLLWLVDAQAAAML